jgi:uncharacterized protein
MAKAPAPPRLNEITVEVADLDPRLDGFTIAHLSDIHVGSLTPAQHIRSAIEIANAAKPDLIALTGDYVCWRRDEAALISAQLAGLKARRVLAVLGNHDYFTSSDDVSRGLGDCGYEVMRNHCTTIDVDGAALTFIGVDDPVTRHHHLGAAFAGAATGPRVVLCHSPQLAPSLSARGADLVLSGHTHGGQLYVKGVTDRILKRLGIHYRRGLFNIDDRTKLYVTPGVGFSGVTRRLGEGTAAEVALLTLRRRLAVSAAA